VAVCVQLDQRRLADARLAVEVDQARRGRSLPVSIQASLAARCCRWSATGYRAQNLDFRPIRDRL
jgi:hypothetical protein